MLCFCHKKAILKWHLGYSAFAELLLLQHEAAALRQTEALVEDYAHKCCQTAVSLSPSVASLFEQVELK